MKTAIKYVIMTMLWWACVVGNGVLVGVIGGSFYYGAIGAAAAFVIATVSMILYQITPQEAKKDDQRQRKQDGV